MKTLFNTMLKIASVLTIFFFLSVCGMENYPYRVNTICNGKITPVFTSGADSIGISWVEVGGAEGYIILRNGTEIARTESSGYLDTNLDAMTTYYYQITAYNTFETCPPDASVDYASTGDDGGIGGLGGGGGGGGGGDGGNGDGDGGASEQACAGGAASGGILYLTWNPSSLTGVTGYNIYRSDSAEGTYSRIGTVDSTTTNYVDSGLPLSATFYYRVSTVLASGEGPLSSYITLRTSPADNPSGLAVGSPTSSSLTLTWNQMSGVDGYRIYRSATETGTFMQIAVIWGAETHTYTDNNGLQYNTTYWYKIAAFNGTTAVGCAGTAVPGTTTSEPYTPSISVGNPTHTSLDITWSITQPPSVDGYRLYRSPVYSTNDSDYTLIATVTPGSASAYTDSSLSWETTYYYRMKAYNSIANGGESQWSNIAGGTTLGWTPVITSVVRDTPPQTALNITWNPVSGADSYNLYWSLDNLTYTQITLGNVTNYIHSPLTPKTLYYYKVTCMHGGIESGFSNIASATTEQYEPYPAYPYVSQGTPSSTVLVISWGAAVNATDYELSVDAGSGFSVIYIGSGLSFNHTSLTPGHTYTYRLRSHNAYGYSAANDATGTTASK